MYGDGFCFVSQQTKPKKKLNTTKCNGPEWFCCRCFRTRPPKTCVGRTRVARISNYHRHLAARLRRRRNLVVVRHKKLKSRPDPFADNQVRHRPIALRRNPRPRLGPAVGKQRLRKNDVLPGSEV